MKKVNPNKIYPVSVLLDVLHEILTHSIELQEECSDWISKNFNFIPGKIINQHIEQLNTKKKHAVKNKGPAERLFTEDIRRHTQTIHEIESGIRHPWK